MHFVHGALGYLVLIGIALIASEARRAIVWRMVLACLAAQIALVALLQKFPPAGAALGVLAQAVAALDHATQAGTQMVFGYLGGAPLPFAQNGAGSTLILAFQVFPLILVIGALSSLLFHWGVMQKLVAAMALALRRATGLGGPLATGAMVNYFVGMIESPILIKNYIGAFSRGELFALMSVGMAGVAGSVMAVYGHILSTAIPGAFAQVLAAAFVSAPAALALAAIMVPFAPAAAGEARLSVESPAHNSLEAIATGATLGGRIMLNVLAQMIVILALAALVDSALAALPDFWGAPLNLKRILSWIFRPLAYAIGVDGPDLDAAAQLLGAKIVFNEFLAYLDLAALPAESLSPRGKLIMLYALCGFANFGSVGIMIGGLSALAPQRRADIAALAPRAMICGALASLLGGAAIAALT